MMKRVLIGTVLGGVVGHLWGMVVWTMLPLYSDVIKTLPNEAAVIEVLSSTGVDTGAYFLPNMPEGYMSDEVVKQEYDAQHAKGPLAFMVYHAGGKPVMPPATIGRGVLFNAVGAFALSMILFLSGFPSYGKRLSLVLFVGLFFIFTGPLMAWNWMCFPLDYTLASVVDMALGTLVVGAVLAGVVRPKVL